MAGVSGEGPPIVLEAHLPAPAATAERDRGPGSSASQVTVPACGSALPGVDTEAGRWHVPAHCP